MIDLSVAIRSHILNDVTLLSLLPDYQGVGAAVFTRRPVPTDAPYPMVLISSLVADNQRDGLNCNQSILTYDVAVYGKNDTAENYRNVEKIANRIHAIFHKIKPYALSMPVGATLIGVNARGPLQAPVDDDKQVGRVVICEFNVRY